MEGQPWHLETLTKHALRGVCVCVCCVLCEVAPSWPGVEEARSPGCQSGRGHQKEAQQGGF